MAGTYSIHRTDEKCTQNFSQVNLKVETTKSRRIILK